MLYAFLVTTILITLAELGDTILVGVVLGRALPEKLITRAAGVLFILFGVGIIAGRYVR